MTVTAPNMQQVLEPGIRKWFFEEFGAGPDWVSMLYNITPSTKAVEHDESIVGSGEIPVFDGVLSYGDLTQGFKVDYPIKTYAKGIAIERDLVDDDQYGIIERRARARGLDAYKTRQLHGIDIFNHAFDTTVFTGGDGKALCAADHPSSNPSLQGAQSNLGTAALSVSGVNAARQAMMSFNSDDGFKANVIPSLLLVAPGNGETAIEICKSMNLANTANNNINSNNIPGMPGYNIEPMVCPLLTNSDAWFLTDARLMKMYLLWMEREAPNVVETGNFDGFLLKYAVRMRHAVGFSDWRWIYGSNPS